MNRDRAKELLPVIQAFSEGKKIQYKDLQTGEWKDAWQQDWFNAEFVGEYRIAPEIVKVESWLIVQNITGKLLAAYTCKEQAEYYKNEYYLTNDHVVVVKMEGSYER